VLHEKAGIVERNLDTEIQVAIDGGTLPSDLAHDLDAVRTTGNFAAHPIKSTSTGEIVDVEPGEADWLLDVASIAGRGRTTLGGVADMPAQSSTPRERLDAQHGLTALGIGFALQTVGYVATIGGTRYRVGWNSGVVGAALAAAAIVLVVGGGTRLRRKREKSLLVDIARWDPITHKRHELPDGHTLFVLGQEAVEHGRMIKPPTLVPLIGRSLRYSSAHRRSACIRSGAALTSSKRACVPLVLQVALWSAAIAF
jgi:hypothetical protein